MSTFISLCHGGSIVTDNNGSFEFVGMSRENILLIEFPSFGELISLVRDRLGWLEESYDVCLEGRIDVIHCLQT